jgi:hypothetical protein
MKSWLARHRRTVVLGLALVALTGWLVGRFWETSLMRSKYESVQIGMTIAEAERVLGAPGFDKQRPRSMEAHQIEADPLDWAADPRWELHNWRRGPNWIFVKTVEGKIAWRCWYREMSAVEAIARQCLDAARDLIGQSSRDDSQGETR